MRGERAAPLTLNPSTPASVPEIRSDKLAEGSSAAPYLLIRKSPTGYQTEGQSSCQLGLELRLSGARSDGVYAVWTWDGQRLQVRNDRYGFFPVYYFSAADCFGISPSIPQLVALGAPTELDYPALATFLQFGCFLGEDTPFKAIRALPPNAALSWEDGRLQVSGGRVVLRPSRITRSEAVSSYIELFAKAMQRRSPPQEDFAVPLSGGRDSRHILLELDRMGFQPRFAATVQWYERQPGDDVETASRLAQALEVPHVVLDQTPWLFEAALRTHRETGFCSGFLLHTWAFALADYLPTRASVIYDGIGGDVLSAGLFVTDRRLELFGEGRFEELAHDVVTPFPLPMVREEEKRRLNPETARDRLVEELRLHADAPNPVGSFFFWNRTRRYISLSPYRILNRHTTVFSPYLDHELYDFLAALPVEIVRDGTFHSDAIRMAYPKWVGIPYSVGRVHWRRDSRYLSRFARKVIAYCAANLSPDLVDRRYVLPRLLRLLVDPRYASAIDWFGPVILYFLRLDRFRRNGHV